LRMRMLLSLMALVAVTVSSCAHRNDATAANPASPSASVQPAAPGQTNRPSMIVTPDDALVGKVVRVDPEGHFVVLNFPIGRLPKLDQKLNVYRLGLKVGVLQVGGPQRDDNIVADLNEGEARVGDEVRDR
jgi:hypothetical protein